MKEIKIYNDSNILCNHVLCKDSSLVNTILHEMTQRDSTCFMMYESVFRNYCFDLRSCTLTIEKQGDLYYLSYGEYYEKTFNLTVAVTEIVNYWLTEYNTILFWAKNTDENLIDED
jgi:hypothetical protein